MRALRAKPILALLAAALVAVIAGVHFQQYVDFISEVPTVGVLFLLNAAGGAGLVIALLSNEALVRRLASVGALGLAMGSLVSIAIALSGSFFGYSEPTLRLPILIAILAEVAAIPTLILLTLHDSRAADTRRPSTVHAWPSR
jgi:hypothetical protein